MCKTLLCVDDEPHILTLYRTLFEEQGYSVLVESNGWDGLAACERFPVDCILLDYQMPGMNGGEFVQHLRHRHSSTPVIVISGTTELPSELLHQVEALIEKPAHIRQLVECIENAIKAAENRLASVPVSVRQAGYKSPAENAGGVDPCKNFTPFHASGGEQ